MMQAATIAAPGRIEMQRLRTPEPGPGQVRIRIEHCGICGSNLPVWEGREWFEYPLPPGQPGHEACGYIDAIGEPIETSELPPLDPDCRATLRHGVSSDLRIGQRVAVLSTSAFAPFDLADASGVLPLPELLDGQPFPGEALGCAMNIFRRAGIQRGQVVGIVGVGFLGALLTQLATEVGAHVIAISRRPFSRQIARRMGARETFPMNEETIANVARVTDGQLCDVVIEAVGQQRPLEIASEMVRERGRLVIAGYHQDGPRQINLQQWNWRGFDVINAHERDPRVYLEGIALAIEAVSSGRLDPTPLYTHRFALEDLGEALEMARTRPDGFLKAIVSIDIENMSG